MRTPIVVSRSSSDSRSISSATDFTAASLLAAAICFRRDCAITSSPTRSISSSSRSAGTRMLSTARVSPRGGAAVPGVPFAAAGAARTGSSSSCMSSSTNRNTCSMSWRGADVVSVTVQPTWQSVARSCSSGGTASVSATTSHAPNARSSSSSSSGLVPFAIAFGGRRMRSRHVVAAAVPVAVVAGTASSRARIAAPSAASAVSGASISCRIWSRAANVVAIRSGVGTACPCRTASNAVSSRWVNAATRSKPNIAPEPLIVCRARKTLSISS